MRGFVVISFIVAILVGCQQTLTNQDVHDDRDSSMINIEIPSEIAQRYGSLNIEHKARNVKKTIHSNGMVSIALSEQQLNSISQEAEKLLREYMEVSTLKQSNNIHNISMNDDFSEWNIFVTNNNVISTEGFELAEEFLIKNTLTYQLVNRQIPTVEIRYYSIDDQLLEEMIIQTQFAYSDE